MRKQSVPPTGREARFADDEIIVSKTDSKGHITYANDVFLRVSGYTEEQLLGQPHSIVRHPDMPRTVFSLMWETIQAGTEIFAYVKNLSSDGDHYWVFAHVTPSFGEDGQILGYHSNRRTPDRRALPTIEALYAELHEIERRAPPGEAVSSGRSALAAKLQTMGMPYDVLMFSLGDQRR